MKANNLTICIDAGCDKNCPYCVSKMTWAPKPDSNLFNRNIFKAQKMAELASISSVLISSKGEPLLNKAGLGYCLDTFRKFPLELQTNGTGLDKNTLNWLYTSGLNTVAISIDSFEDIYKFVEICNECNRLGLVIRFTIILSSLWKCDPNRLLKLVKELGIKQLTFRNVTVPDKIVQDKKAEGVREWILANGNYEANGKFMYYFRRNYEPKNLIRELPFGASVYDCAGVAVTELGYCIQESNNTEDIRSLIYHQDGHMYTSWDKQSSILF